MAPSSPIDALDIGDRVLVGVDARLMGKVLGTPLPPVYCCGELMILVQLDTMAGIMACCRTAVIRCGRADDPDIIAHAVAGGRA